MRRTKQPDRPVWKYRFIARDKAGKTICDKVYTDSGILPVLAAVWQGHTIACLDGLDVEQATEQDITAFLARFKVARGE